jgi:MFS transporter, OFA family, oxalate/formate antiporter
MDNARSNRWFLAAAGVIMQIALGAVYAWSVFRIPLTTTYGWTISQVTLTFEIAIFVLGFASLVGGLWMRRAGPRPVAIAAGILYGLGTILAGQADGNITLLYLSYGLIGGIGLGFGYIVPLATLIKWFPDRRGMITGLAVAGFGAGALVTAPLADRLLTAVGIPSTFAILGTIYLIAVVGAGLFMRNPPDGYRPEGWHPFDSAQGRPTTSQGARAAHDYSLGEALRTWQWYGLWLILFLNTTAGISIISQASPMAQEMTHVNAAIAAGLVGAISIANGAGRLLWAWLSDFTGRRQVFVTMFLAQAVMFMLLARVEAFGALGVLAFIVLLCYGGGFGTMPAFAADFFGAANIGSIYGLMLTAWGFAAVVGPTIIARIREVTGHYTEALDLLAIVMLVGAAIPFLVRPNRDQQLQPATKNA